MNTLTEEQMHMLCSSWKSVLCPEWDVQLQVVRGPIAGGLGECDLLVNRKQVLIRLLHPDDYYMIKWMPGDPADIGFEQERVLVHELMHTRFAALDTLIGEGTVAEVVLEQAMHGLDVSLVELAHAGRNQMAAAAA